MGLSWGLFGLSWGVLGALLRGVGFRVSVSRRSSIGGEEEILFYFYSVGINLINDIKSYLLGKIRTIFCSCPFVFPRALRATPTQSRLLLGLVFFFGGRW